MAGFGKVATFCGKVGYAPGPECKFLMQNSPKADLFRDQMEKVNAIETVLHCPRRNGKLAALTGSRRDREFDFNDST